MMKRLAIIIALLSMIATGIYVFVYLYRWEWNRALIAGVLFLAAEGGLTTILILGRLQRLENAQATSFAHSAGARSRMPGYGSEQARLLQVIQEVSSPAQRAHFAWLNQVQKTTDDNRTGVFIPVLIGAGLVFSTVAWIIEKIARMTANPTLEKGLAARLSRLSLPEDGFLDPNPSTDILLTPVIMKQTP